MFWIILIIIAIVIIVVKLMNTTKKSTVAATDSTEKSSPFNNEKNEIKTLYDVGAAVRSAFGDKKLNILQLEEEIKKSLNINGKLEQLEPSSPYYEPVREHFEMFGDVQGRTFNGWNWTFTTVKGGVIKMCIVLKNDNENPYLKETWVTAVYPLGDVEQYKQ